MSTEGKEPKASLSLFDSVCLIVGIIIGAGIYETAPLIAASLSSPSELYLFWFLGGLFSLAGALCYAELSAAYPKVGGDLHYLRSAFGPVISFLFGWGRFIVVRPGSIAAMAFVFGRYADAIYSLGDNSVLIYAIVSVLVLTLTNAAGLAGGVLVQNALTVLKVLGLAFVVVLPFILPSELPELASAPDAELNYSLAMILILFTFGGWNEIAFVAGEVRRPERNLLRSLVLGTLLVTVTYLIANLAFVQALGFAGLQASQAVAVSVVKPLLGSYASSVVSVLICISALGAVNGLILTGARISYAFGKQERLFHFLGSWDSRRSAPLNALLLQALISLAVTFWTGSFGGTIVYTTAVVWFFFLLTGLSLFILRWKDSQTQRPYRVSLYPVTPIVFCASCLFLIYGSLSYDFWGSVISIAVFLFGLVFYRRESPS